MFATGKLTTRQRNSQSVICTGQKDNQSYQSLSQQELECQKQVKRLCIKLSKAVQQERVLCQHKQSLQQNKLHLNSVANESGTDLSKQLLTLRQKYKQAEQKYGSVRNQLIANSLQIRKANKQINQVRECVNQREQVFSQMKKQTMSLKQKQANSIIALKQMQQQLKTQSIRRIELIKNASQSKNASSKRADIVNRISEMQKINSILNQMINI